MRSIKTSLMAVVAMAATSLPAPADYLVKEVGSFHVGGRTAAVSGMPTRDVVFSPGAPPIKVDPNGEFAVEQMYVQYVKLAAESEIPDPAVARGRPQRRHLGDQTRWQARLAAIFPQHRL
jgi:hypothetical protein